MQIRSCAILLCRLMVSALLLTLAACRAPDWPQDRFTEDVTIERILFSQGSDSIREACQAVVAELTDASAQRLIDGRSLSENGWKPSPLPPDQRHIQARAALGGCENGGPHPLGDLEGALVWPGSYYKLVNGGEGLAIVAPRSRLAG